MHTHAHAHTHTHTHIHTHTHTHTHTRATWATSTLTRCYNANDRYNVVGKYMAKQYPEYFGAIMTYERFLWAHLIIETRAFSCPGYKDVDSAGSTWCLVPYMDLINHQSYVQIKNIPCFSAQTLLWTNFAPFFRPPMDFTESDHNASFFNYFSRPDLHHSNLFCKYQFIAFLSLVPFSFMHRYNIVLHFFFDRIFFSIVLFVLLIHVL
jgi:hypothetical protein